MEKLLKKEFIKKTIIVLGIVGIVLIFISTLVESDTKNSNNNNEVTSTKSYCEKLQTELENIISYIDGVGRTKILLTIDTSSEIVYQEKSENQTKQLEPKIRGVIVVCDGGNNPIVVQNIINALRSVLDISASKISVSKLSN